MKKLFLSLIALLLSFASVFSNIAYANTVSFVNDYDYGAEAYQNMEDFVNANPYRNERKESNQASADYIKSKLNSWGVTAEVVSFDHYEDSTNSTVKTAFNTYGSIVYDTNATYTLFICHIDSYYADDSSKNFGVYNATGVGFTLTLAKYFAENIGNENILFAFLDAEETGFYGSHELQKMLNDREYADKIDLVVNFDYLGGGDNLYMYADEIDRVHESFARNIIGDYVSIADTPKNKNILQIESNSGIQYSHMGLYSSIQEFYKNGYNCLDFFGGSWTASYHSYFTESIDNNSIINTADDNLDKFGSLYKNSCITRLNGLFKGIATMVNADDYVVAMEKSKTQSNVSKMLGNGILTAYICGGIVLVFACIITIMAINRSKKYKKYNPFEQLINKNNNENYKVFDEFDI